LFLLSIRMEIGTRISPALRTQSFRISSCGLPAPFGPAAKLHRIEPRNRFPSRLRERRKISASLARKWRNQNSS
jgi:hypothetical protein